MQYACPKIVRRLQDRKIDVIITGLEFYVLTKCTHRTFWRRAIEMSESSLLESSAGFAGAAFGIVFAFALGAGSLLLESSSSSLTSNFFVRTDFGLILVFKLGSSSVESSSSSFFVLAFDTDSLSEWPSPLPSARPLVTSCVTSQEIF